jgi:thiamine-monophosphate kinase
VRPSPPLSLGQEAARGGLRCGIDVSDGLLQDIGHICEMSGLGALVRADSVPTSPDLTSAYPQDALRLACTGGEDYELVLVGDRERIERAGAASGVAVTVIGEIAEDDERRTRLLDGGGNEINLGSPGWDHLRGTAFERRA